MLGDLVIHAGQNAVEEFDDVDLAAEAAPHGTELQSDHAGADHQHLAGHGFEIECAGRGHDGLFIDLDARQLRHVGAGRDNDALGRQRCRLAAVGNDADEARAVNAADAVERIDLVLLQEKRDAVDVALDAFRLERVHLAEIERR